MDAGTMREGSKELVALVDVVIASETFLRPLAGTNVSHEKTLRAIKEFGAGQVVVTLGPKGSVGMNEHGIMIRQKAFSVRAKDTTGAGDVYHGAYLYGLLQGWDMPECMSFASTTAALKCTMIGAQTGIPDLQTVREFMKAHKKKSRKS
jgi:sugar/nucleoside kinase (ribokinase family)